MSPLGRWARALAETALALATVVPGLHGQQVAVKRLAPRLYVLRTTAGSNVLAVAASGGTLLVDAGPADGVEVLARAIDSLSVGPVRYVVNTHYHDDHIGGNPYFVRRGAVVIGHPAARAAAQLDTVIEEFNNWRRVAAPREALPSAAVDGPMTLYLGTDTVRIVPAPGAHTAGDLVVHVAPGDVVHTGDIYEVGTYPFIDVWAGGSIGGMQGATQRMLANGGAGTRYVPGHGSVGGRAQLERYLTMLTAVCQTVARERDAGASLEAVMAARPTAAFDETTWGPARHGRVLAALVFRSLERATGCGAETELRALHQRLLEAHRRGDVGSWVAVEGEGYVSVDNGVIRVPTREERWAARQRYLATTAFTVYRDLREPVVHLSDDGMMGWLIADVEIRGTQRRADGGSTPVEETWNWTELYQRQPAGWKLIGTVSNRRP